MYFSMYSAGYRRASFLWQVFLRRQVHLLKNLPCQTSKLYLPEKFVGARRPKPNPCTFPTFLGEEDRSTKTKSSIFVRGLTDPFVVSPRNLNYKVHATEPKSSKLKILQQNCYKAIYSSLLQSGDQDVFEWLVDDKSVVSCQQTCCKFTVKPCYQQACYKFIQQVVTSLQITSCKKPDFNRLVGTWSNSQVCYNG